MEYNPLSLHFNHLTTGLFLVGASSGRGRNMNNICIPLILLPPFDLISFDLYAFQNIIYLYIRVVLFLSFTSIEEKQKKIT